MLHDQTVFNLLLQMVPVSLEVNWKYIQICFVSSLWLMISRKEGGHEADLHSSFSAHIETKCVADEINLLGLLHRSKLLNTT